MHKPDALRAEDFIQKLVFAKQSEGGKAGIWNARVADRERKIGRFAPLAPAAECQYRWPNPESR